MGRPEKKGLDYFPMNVDFFEDEKLEFVFARFGNKGLALVVKLLCKIYKEGYAIRWDDDISTLFATRVGEPHTLVNDVVHELVKRGFFNQGIFDRFQMLTSKGIQQRYVKIATDARRKNVFPPTEIDLTHEETKLTPEFSTQSKVKESKEKNIDTNVSIVKSKDLPKKVGDLFQEELKKHWQDMPKTGRTILEFVEEHRPLFPEPYISLWNAWAKNKGRSKPEVMTLTDKRKKHLKKRLEEQHFDFPKILVEAAKSQLLISGNWFTFDWIIESENNYIKLLEGKYRDAEQPEVIQPESDTIRMLTRKMTGGAHGSK